MNHELEITSTSGTKRTTICSSWAVYPTAQNGVQPELVLHFEDGRWEGVSLKDIQSILPLEDRP